MELQFQKVGGGTGTISLDQIRNMTMPEFVMLEGRLMRVRRKKRRDLAIWKAGKIVTPADAIDIFRKGLTQLQKYANDEATYEQTPAHTNMGRDGEFEYNSVTIFSKIEVYQYQTGLQGSSTVPGMVTNPKGVALAGYDPFLVNQSWLNQTKLEYWEGEEMITDGLLEEFPQSTGQSGVAGATVGALAQNVYNDNNALENPRVIMGGQDFRIRLLPLCPFDLTVANGLPIDMVTEIKFRTTEFRNPAK